MVEGFAPPELGVKLNVVMALLLLGTRSMGAMVNITAVTAPPITPQDTAGLETVGSAFVCTVTEAVSALAMPSVQPAR